MNGYLLDTDICIFFLQGKYGLSGKIDAVGIENCFISEITIAELLFGAENSTNYAQHIEEISLFEQHFRIIPIYNVLNTYAKEKTRLKKKGIIITEFDLLIGSTALTHDLVMVTGNGNHLGKIQGIQIENWTQR